MRIKKLKLKNFRNFSDQSVSFFDGLNVIFGKNAQGKTNCAEAVFYLCTGTSPRCKRDKQLIKIGEEYAEIEGEFESAYGNMNVYVKIFENGREMRLNGNKISRSADMIGNVTGVFFSPRELRLVQDGPDERRKFLNVSLCQLYKNYFVALSRYNKILEQRNNLLKDKDVTAILDTLPIWDAQLCRYAATVILKRVSFVKNIAKTAREIHDNLSGGERLEISLDKNYPSSEAEIEKKLFSELEKNYEKDIRLGFTSCGPHRDDLNILINGEDAKIYASQGQTRSLALSIKLAEVEEFKEVLSEPPILILDDVMSELDLPRRKKLASYTGGQIILTCTHAERALYGKTATKIKVDNGKFVF